MHMEVCSTVKQCGKDKQTTVRHTTTSTQHPKKNYTPAFPLSHQETLSTIYSTLANYNELPEVRLTTVCPLAHLPVLDCTLPNLYVDKKLDRKNSVCAHQTSLFLTCTNFLCTNCACGTFQY
ncbi:hypothetical protein CLIB1423_36S00628 [[Candida] railenensis]|uniref:Uncharacterized protein n=1 Tax=[Candida] railenensis TaxID=45579 RepID=A0A9P0QVJ9_9ASCO|nr:hypothetical protein CLIB1423_36S00628 [[Candida] railenensis]